jgi:hypothetical protein
MIVANNDVAMGSLVSRGFGGECRCNVFSEFHINSKLNISYIFLGSADYREHAGHGIKFDYI